jgi:probable phosphoglycerate mutase
MHGAVTRARPRDSLPSVRRLLLARHGETAWNAIGRLQGRTDIELNDAGREQARSLAVQLGDAGIQAVWTSDLSRARQTGEIVAAALRLAPPQIDPELRERSFGVFEGLTRDECATRHPEAWQAWQAHTAAPPGGESRESVCARMTSALARILASEGGPALVVSHGGVMRLWLMQLLGTQIPLIPNGATWLVEQEGTTLRARLATDK